VSGLPVPDRLLQLKSEDAIYDKRLGKPSSFVSIIPYNQPLSKGVLEGTIAWIKKGQLYITLDIELLTRVVKLAKQAEFD